jgi:hypothetical protein
MSIDMSNHPGAQRELTLEEIEWGPEGKPSKELLEVRACMAKINERERLKEAAKLKQVLPYSDSLAQEICERIAIGELLLNICGDEHLPSMRRCYQWLHENPEFDTLYKSAINDRLNVFEEQVIQIADDSARDFKTITKNGVEKRIHDPDMVARAKLRIDTRFRHLKAGRPAKWGDVQTLITKDGDSVDISNLTPEELEKQIGEIEKKSRCVRAVA